VLGAPQARAESMGHRPIKSVLNQLCSLSAIELRREDGPPLTLRSLGAVRIALPNGCQPRGRPPDPAGALSGEPTRTPFGGQQFL